MTAADEERRRRRFAGLLGLVAVGVTAGVFHRAVGFELTTWDDDQHIVENEFFHPLTWRSVLYFWQYSHIYLYIPVSYTFFAFEAWLSQFFPTGDPAVPFNPAVFHTGTLVLHLASTWLAYRIFLKLVPWAPAALAGALLFGIHPLQTESVCWVGETRGTLAMFFQLAAWWFHLQGAGVDAERGVSASAAPPPRFAWGRYLAATACFAAALLSKPSAAPWPAVVFVLDVLLLRRTVGGSALRMAPWLAGSLVILLLTKHYQRTDLVYTPAVRDWDERLFVAGDTYAFYLQKTAWPAGLTFDYSRTPQRVVELPYFRWHWLLPVGVGLLLGVLPGRRYAWSAYSVFLLMIAPVSGLVPFLYQTISTTADRYMYVPMVGFGLGLAFWLAARRRPAPYFIAAMFVLGLSARGAYEQSAYWRDDFALYGRGIDVNPRSYVAEFSLGNALRKQGRYEEAIRHFTRTLENRPDYYFARRARGECFLALGRLSEAAVEFEAALRIVPGWYDALMGYGEVLMQQGSPVAAGDAFRRAALTRPDDPLPLVAWGALQLQQDDAASAAELFAQATKLSPGNADVALRIGRAWLRAERYSEATVALESAVAIDPNAATPRADLTGAYVRLGKFGPAVEQGAAAVRLSPGAFEAHYNFGLALAAVGRTDEARRHLTTARGLATPGSPQASAAEKGLHEAVR